MVTETSQPAFTESATASGIAVIEKAATPWFAPHASELDWFFPQVDPMHRPLGNKVLVQLKRTKRKTKSGIQLVSETKETEKWNTQVGKVIALGPIAYHNRSTGEPWPEGMWVAEGDFVRCPRWGGDRWEIPMEGEPEDPALFVVFNDHEIFAEVTGDPLKVKAFIL